MVAAVVSGPILAARSTVLVVATCVMLVHELLVIELKCSWGLE